MSRGVTTTDLQDLLLGEFGMRELFAFPMSVLSNHVRSILGASSKEKVFWVNTRRIIAFVEDAHSFWNIAPVKSPRQSVHEGGKPCAERNPAVTPLISSSIPNPARLGLGNSSEEPFLNGRLWGWIVKMALAKKRTKLPVPFVVENFAATRTLFLDHTKIFLSMVREGTCFTTGSLNCFKAIKIGLFEKGESFGQMLS